jgi:hypothetical protein
MSKLIYPLTEEVALQVASSLLPEDRREVEEGHGHDPKVVIPLASHLGDSVYFKAPNGEIAGAAGVHNEGQIWMLCTKVILKYPHTFARESKRFVNSRKEKLLWNVVDKRNALHLKLLRFLGFKFIREISYGPNNLSFIEFCRVQSISDGDRLVRSRRVRSAPRGFSSESKK